MTIRKKRTGAFCSVEIITDAAEFALREDLGSCTVNYSAEDGENFFCKFPSEILQLLRCALAVIQNCNEPANYEREQGV